MFLGWIIVLDYSKKYAKILIKSYFLKISLSIKIRKSILLEFLSLLCYRLYMNFSLESVLASIDTCFFRVFATHKDLKSRF